MRKPSLIMLLAGVIFLTQTYLLDASPKKQEALPLAGKVIVLDAGHGGPDPGAVRLGVKEKDITLNLCKHLKKKLEKLGAKVVMTRSDDSDIGLVERTALVEHMKADFFISIHVNSSARAKSPGGLQTYFRTDHRHSRLFAHTMHGVMCKSLYANNKGVHTARFWVVNQPVPAVLLEVGYISNDKDRKRLVRFDYQDKLCDSVVQGLLSYLEKKRILCRP